MWNMGKTASVVLEKGVIEFEHWTLTKSCDTYVHRNAP